MKKIYGQHLLLAGLTPSPNLSRRKVVFLGKKNDNKMKIYHLRKKALEEFFLKPSKLCNDLQDTVYN